MSSHPQNGSRAARWSRVTVALCLSILLSGSCTLDPTVTVYPIFLTPSDDRPFGNLVNLVEARDYGGAISRRWTVQQKRNPSARELAALGHLEMARGRLDDARQYLTAALDRAVSRDDIAAIAWDLSQAEFLADEYAKSLEWALRATDNGLRVAPWHIQLLDSLSGIDAETNLQGSSGTMPMIFGNPDVPRVEASVNGAAPVAAVIDSGAVFTIVSETLATRTNVRRLGRRGTLLGLLDEPIPIEFGIVEDLQIGDLHANGLLVAVMSDADLRFFVLNRETFQMDLLLGTNLLRGLRIDLNFLERKIELTPVSQHAPSADQNLFFVDFRPMAQVSINRKGWFLFLLDTGSEITFLNESLVERTAAGGRGRLHWATLQGLGGSKKRGSQIVGVELATAGWGGTFRTLPMYASRDSEAFGILGENFLSQFHVVIDFGKMRLDLLSPAARAFDDSIR